MQYDADCELFDKIISGDLCEEVYYDQVPRAPDPNLKLWLETTLWTGLNLNSV